MKLMTEVVEELLKLFKHFSANNFQFRELFLQTLFFFTLMKFSFTQWRECSINHCQGQHNSMQEHLEIKNLRHSISFFSQPFFLIHWKVRNFPRSISSIKVQIQSRNFFPQPVPTSIPRFNRCINLNWFLCLKKYLQKHSWAFFSGKKITNIDNRASPLECLGGRINLKHFSFAPRCYFSSYTTARYLNALCQHSLMTSFVVSFLSEISHTSTCVN